MGTAGLRSIGGLGTFVRGLPRNFRVMMVRSSVAPFVVMAAVDGCMRMPIVYKLVPESMDPEGSGPADSGFFTD